MRNPLAWIGDMLNERARDALIDAITFCPECGHGARAYRHGGQECADLRCRCPYHGTALFGGATGPREYAVMPFVEAPIVARQRPAPVVIPDVYQPLLP